ncbi:exonuclease [Acinetobacter phage AB-Navy71]|uniref:Exonuclease A n=1 Tax=Acinetobacter phage AbTZA1 TaxID=2500827 RepID=A0A3T0IGQ8_9CAUD|nr:exonuclease A [Acinetobacter phage AbTZA1]AZU98597.1 exonuclease A [Acinetobacter phage AbTZA1]UQS94088.1 exonuclease [Acinetobacter phage AB-Navy71]
MAKYNDFIIDLETLGNKPDCIVVDLSVLVFDPDPTVVQSLDELIANGRRFKLNLQSQKGIRSTTPSTVKWWSEQSPEAKKNLLASPEDLTVEEAITQVLDFLKRSNINQWKSQGWCRGMSFDFPIFVDMIRQAFKTNDTDKLEPIKFHCQRDIRTAIEAYSLVRGMTKTPLRKGVLDGFVHHDSIHDCAKDVIMLKTAQRYALQLEDMPEKDDVDPQTT